MPTPQSQAPSPWDYGDRQLLSEAPGTWPSVRGVPGHQYTLLGTAPETLRTRRSPNEQPQKTGRIRFFMMEGHGCRTSAAWRPRRPPPAQKSSKAAATVLCPKMKVPTSTETTPHTSKQHLPGQYTHTSTCSPLDLRAASRAHGRKLIAGSRPSHQYGLGAADSTFFSLTCRSGFPRQRGITAPGN